MTSNAGRIGSVTMCLLLAQIAAGAEFAGGTGEPNDPYRIATAGQLMSIGSDPNLLDKHFVLLNDIDLDPNLPGGRTFTQAVIAHEVPPDYPSFTGSFDGGGHEIHNLTMHADKFYLLGLFGRMGHGGVVRDLGIMDARVDAPSMCGALAGMNEGCVRRCYARSRISAASFAGGLVGYNDDGEIIDCRVDGEVTAGDSVGGLVAENWGTILNCHASSRVVLRWTGNESHIGGLVGMNWADLVNCYATGDVSALTLMQMGGGLAGANSTGTIVNCHATGNVSAARGTSLGGLVGENTGFIVHSWATGNVSGGTSALGTRDGKPAGSRELGGLVGRNWEGHIYACYARGDVSGGDGGRSLGGLVGSQSQWGDTVDSYCVGRVRTGENSTSVGGLVGSGGGGIRASFWDVEASGLAQSDAGTGLTTAQMQNAATFLAAGWDCVGESGNGLVDPWFFPEGGGYPMLTFQSEAFQPHQLDGGGTVDDPYRIVTPEDLGAINHYDLAACYRLEADINLASITWKESPVRYFNGRLDGAGRTVFHLEVRGDSYLGLFGVLDRNASVTDLGIADANVAGRVTLGMLAGKNRGCVAACRADGVVSGIGGIGGLICSNEGSISDCCATGKAEAISPSVGGLAAWNAGLISRCYAATHVPSTASVQGHADVAGGLVGDNNGGGYLHPPGEVRDSYFLIDAEGGGPGNGFGTALTIVQMRQKGSFLAWDFDDIWQICEGRDYPRLRWENAGCGE